jgi:hypothetical protein
MSLKTIILHAFTGKDNETVDIGRVLWAISVLSFVVMGFIGAYKGQVTDYLQYGSGIAAVLAAGGAAIGLKSKTEPGNKE